MMNYWQRKTLAEEAKANQIAIRQAREQKRYLQRAQKLLEKEIAALQAEILAEGANPTRTTLWRYGKYVELQETIDKQINATGAHQIGLLDDAARTVFENRLETLMSELGGGTARFQQLNKLTVDQAVKQVWQGSDFSSRVWHNTNLLAKRVKGLVDEALILGRSPQHLSTQLQNQFGVSYSYAERLIRTELSHTFNTASMVAYKAAGLTQVEVMVGKDERLCSVCAEAEGTYYIGSEPTLPLHPFCRCCYQPVVSEQEN